MLRAIYGATVTSISAEMQVAKKSILLGISLVLLVHVRVLIHFELLACAKCIVIVIESFKQLPFRALC